MRATDLYCTTCARCGQAIESPAPEGTCACGAQFRMEWPARIRAAKEVKNEG